MLALFSNQQKHEKTYEGNKYMHSNENAMESGNPIDVMVDLATRAMNSIQESAVLPALSHLQWLITTIIGPDEVTGKNLRIRLEQRGVRKSGPSFYQLMSRLEEAGYVEGRYVSEVIDGQIIKERVYTVSPKGLRVRNDTEMFYSANRQEITLRPVLAP